MYEPVDKEVFVENLEVLGEMPKVRQEEELCALMGRAVCPRVTVQHTGGSS